MPKKEEHAFWTDVLGNTYSPGDLIAYASISRRSPQLVFGEVVRINKFNSKGQVIEKRSRGNTPGVWATKPSCSVTVRPVLDARGFHRTRSKSYYEMNPDGSTNWNKRIRTEEVPARLVTLQIPENIIAIRVTEADVDGTVEKLMQLHESLEGGNE